MNIKRKTIMNSDGGLQGGGHAPESVLDSEWEAIKMHTGWKLEPCFKPVFISDNASVPDDSAAAKVSDAHEAHDVMSLSIPPLIIQFTHQTITSTDASCLPPLIIQFTHQTITSTDASCLPPLIIQFTHQTITSTDASCLPPLIIQFTHQTITSTDASCLPPLIVQFLQRMLHVKVTILITIQLKLHLQLLF